MDTYKALVEMGFSEVRAASALRQANNDVNNALQVREYVRSSPQPSSFKYSSWPCRLHFLLSS